MPPDITFHNVRQQIWGEVIVLRIIVKILLDKYIRTS